MPSAHDLVALGQGRSQLRHAVLHEPVELVSIARLHSIKAAIAVWSILQVCKKLCKGVRPLEGQSTVQAAFMLQEPNVVDSLQGVLLGMRHQPPVLEVLGTDLLHAHFLTCCPTGLLLVSPPGHKGQLQSRAEGSLRGDVLTVQLDVRQALNVIVHEVVADLATPALLVLRQVGPAGMWIKLRVLLPMQGKGRDLRVVKAGLEDRGDVCKPGCRQHRLRVAAQAPEASARLRQILEWLLAGRHSAVRVHSVYRARSAPGQVQILAVSRCPQLQGVEPASFGGALIVSMQGFQWCSGCQAHKDHHSVSKTHPSRRLLPA
mmetsp:Transcript_122731/g.291899  ORF Transcript_122731/g.291899 Transcript_122731/m.291899 type:complete len:318 (-) Transcript_122731:49-1002(-)